MGDVLGGVKFYQGSERRGVSVFLVLGSCPVFMSLGIAQGNLNGNSGCLGVSFFCNDASGSEVQARNLGLWELSSVLGSEVSQVIHQCRQREPCPPRVCVLVVLYIKSLVMKMGLDIFASELNARSNCLVIFWCNVELVRIRVS